MLTHAIVISGSMGSGKTTLLGEASDLLAARSVVHAVVDLDALGTVGLLDNVAAELVYRNLQSVCANFVEEGVSRLLLAEAIESRDQLARIQRLLPAASITVCRLVADPATLERRLRVREPGLLQETFVARARELDAILDRAGVEDFTIRNDEGSVTAAAREMLDGWRLAHSSEATAPARLLERERLPRIGGNRPAVPGVRTGQLLERAPIKQEPRGHVSPKAAQRVNVGRRDRKISIEIEQVVRARVPAHPIAPGDRSLHAPEPRRSSQRRL
jgi:predicted kinase